MAANNSITKNFLFSAFLTSANYLFPLLTFPYVSRVLGVENIGLVNFIDGIINYFCIFAMMGVEAVGQREISAARGNKAKLTEVFNSLQIVNVVLMSAVLVVLAVSTIMVPRLAEQWPLMAIGALKVVFTCFLVQWLFKGLEEFKFITMRAIAVRLLYVIGVFVFVRKSTDYVIYFALIVGTIGLNALVDWLTARRHVSFSLRNLSFKGLWKPSFILGLYILLTNLYTTFNVVYLGFVAGDTQVGYYSTSIKLFTILLAVYTAFTGVMMPRMTYLRSQGRIDEFRAMIDKSIDVLIAVSLPIVALCTIYAPEIVWIMSGPGYQGAIVPMMIVMPLVFIIGYEQILVIQVLMAAKHDNVIVRNSIAGAITGITLNILIVKNLMAIGSSLVWVACELLILVLSQIAVKRLYNLSFPFATVVKGIGLYLPLAAGLLALKLIGLNSFPALIVAGIVTVGWFMTLQFTVYKHSYVTTMLVALLGKLHIVSRIHAATVTDEVHNNNPGL